MAYRFSFFVALHWLIESRVLHFRIFNVRVCVWPPEGWLAFVRMAVVSIGYRLCELNKCVPTIRICVTVGDCWSVTRYMYLCTLATGIPFEWPSVIRSQSQSRPWLCFPNIAKR